MLSNVLLVIVGSLALFCGLFNMATSNDKGSRSNNNREYQLAAKDLSKDIKSDVSMDTDTIKSKSDILNATKLNDCVIIKYGNKDYRYLDNLDNYGIERLPNPCIGIHIDIDYWNEPEVSISNRAVPTFYIDSDRLFKIDADLYSELLKVKAINTRFMHIYNQRNIDHLRELFERLDYVSNSQINRYIKIGRSIKYMYEG